MSTLSQESTAGAAGAFPPAPAPVPAADRTLDCRGKLCPGPLIETHLAMRALQPGQVLEVLTTDLGALRDIPAFARNTGHELLQTRSDGPVTHFYLRKTAKPPS